MTPKQASKIIGVTPQQVQYACRTGLLPAKKKKLDNGNPSAYCYDIKQKDVEYYRDNRPPRGPKPRNKE